MAVLLGTASAQITLDISQFMANAKTAGGAMNELAATGTGPGTRGPNFLDRLGTSALALGTALVVPMAAGLKTAVDLEQQMANVDAALGDISDADLGNLADQFNEIATSSQYSAIQIGAVGEELAKAGIAEDDIAGVTQAVVNLSQATGTTLDQSIQALTTTVAIFSDGMVDAEHVITDFNQVADILTTVTNSTRASMTDINAGMRSLAPAGARAGLSFNELAAAIGFFVDLGLPGADAGISLTRALTDLATPGTEAALLMEELGIQAYDLATGEFIGLPALFDQLQTAMVGMTDQQKEAALSMIFGAEAIDVIGLAALQGGDPLRALIDLTYEQGTASEQSAIRMNTLSAQFGTLKEGINTFLGSLVSGLIPGMRVFVDMANQVIDVLMRIPAPIKTIIGTIAGLLAGFAAISAGIRTFAALNAFLGGAGILTGGLGAALGGVLAPLLLIGAAVGALYLAWRTNFLGIGDIVDRFGNGIRRFAKTFRDSFKNLTTATYQWGDTVEDIVPTMGRFPAFFLALGNAIATIGGGVPVLQDIGQAMIALGDSIRYGAEAYSYFREQGLDPVQAGLRAIGLVIPEVSGLTDALQLSIGRVTEAFREFSAGNFTEGIQLIGSAAATAFDALVDLGGQIVGWALDVAAPTITGWIVDVAGDVWGAITFAAGFVWDGFVELGGWVLDTLPPDITGWLLDFASDAWGALKTAAGYAGSFIATITSWVLDVIPPDVTGWLQSLAADAWGALTTAAGMTASIVADMAAWTLDVIEPTVSGWLTNVGGWIAEQIGLQDFAPVGTTTQSKVLAAISTAFSAGGALGGATGGVFNIGASILNWIDRQISELNADGVGQKIGQKIGAGLVKAFGSGGAFAVVATAFSQGFTNAIAEKVSSSGFVDSFWGAFDALAQFSGDVFEGIAEGFLNEFRTAILGDDGTIELGGIKIDVGTIEFDGELAAAFKEAFIAAAIPGGQLTLDVLGIGGEDEDTGDGADTGDAGRRIVDAAGDMVTLAAASGVAAAALAEFRHMAALGGAGATTASAGIALAQRAVDGIKPGADGAGFALRSLVDIFIETSTAAEGMKTAFTGVDQVKTAFTGISEAAATAEPQVSLLAASFDKMQLSVGLAMATLNSSVSTGMATIIATMANGAATATAAAGSLFAGVADTITGVMTRAQFAVISGMNQIVVAFANKGALATQSLANALAPIPDIVRGVGTRAQFAAVNAGNSIATGFQTGAAKAPALVSAALSGVSGAVSRAGIGAAAAARAAGANIGAAMAAGIRSQIGAVYDAAAALGAAATIATAGKLKISSPSKVFIQLGEYVGQGFEMGIRSMIPATTMAASDLAYIPNVTPGQYASTGHYTGSGGGGAQVIVHAPVTVQGNVTTERDLIANAAGEISMAIVESVQRNRVAAGVS